MDTEETKQYHYLVAGNVIISIDDSVQSIPQNAMILTDVPNIGLFQLGKAQQALQLTLFKKMGETVQVVDVIINNVVLLGHMTPSEFNATPEGVAIQERPRPSAEIVDFPSEILGRG